jgi:predicted RNA-binding Zn-ribbon protein involved in translation (DUF1610 family)
VTVIDCATCGASVNADVLHCPECGNDPRVKGELPAGQPSSEARSCPSCSSPMVAGVVVGRSPGVKFKERRDALGDLGGVTLTDGVFTHSVAAWRCPACGTVLIPPR